MIEQAAWLIQPIKGNRSKRLSGLPASSKEDKEELTFYNREPVITLFWLVLFLPDRT